ncbi:ATP-binding cassette domain-containing protein [Sinorhizobium medicae]|uniref:ABC transporter ATP-binding protein n=1 Tax=Sinorhizobium medicae TaxID=110321 RepID=UPI001298220D|nr:ABC transporter ATP-binding protein [Sinorhizobium medicae]MDX0415041.1 ATP-binding cassette domain-containing protein [Sinorhizobium medicae]MDX0476142.1 ATP-binding cassette domain-containing protein [Sinorhizobium medicae]MQV85174.1 ATP-binding cassette domain-containing protein [Sinorhizobium medicae]MQV89909.1 ATP-binding cassette domain-containing protein [Sinorhizobium medicae]
MSDIINIRQVTKTFGEGSAMVTALENVSLSIKEGEFVVFLGPSGCGKSTLLRMLAGLSSTSAGSLTIEGRPVEGRDPSVGMVFQSYTSFPWLTVAENIGFGLDLAKADRATTRAKVHTMLERVALAKFAKSYPSQLSGGMQQRVAIARALAVDPRILLMDEPFGALDALTRVEMQTLLLDLCAQDRKTVVFVTHDIDEAMLLADRIVVFSPHPGRIAEIIDVDIPHPRTIDQTEREDFTHLRHRLRQLLFSMARKAA